MKETCDIIRDLLPLYKDKVCSDESKREVEAHLETCEECKAEFILMNTEISSADNEIKKEKALNAAAFARKKIKSKAFIKGCVIAASVIVFLALAAVGNYCGHHYFTTVKADDEVGLTRLAENYIGYSDLSVIKTAKKGDYVAVMFKDNNDGTINMYKYDRDEVFKNRYRVSGGVSNVNPGMVASWNSDSFKGDAIIIVFGDKLRDDAEYYEFYNGGNHYICSIEENSVLDIFIFVDSNDITGMPVLLDKDENKLSKYYKSSAVESE